VTADWVVKGCVMCAADRVTAGWVVKGCVMCAADRVTADWVVKGCVMCAADRVIIGVTTRWVEREAGVGGGGMC
jgi:hypothetical protein